MKEYTVYIFIYIHKKKKTKEINKNVEGRKKNNKV